MVDNPTTHIEIDGQQATRSARSWRRARWARDFIPEIDSPRAVAAAPCPYVGMNVIAPIFACCSPLLNSPLDQVQAGLLGREKRGLWVSYRLVPERLQILGDALGAQTICQSAG